MGRKRKVKTGTFDRIGEEVNLEKCPECTEHNDCFSCIDGKCTALNACGGQGCSFYKPAGKGFDDCRAAFRKLKETGCFDLIQTYIKAYAAMGFLDEEIEAETRKARRLEDYRESDFRTLMTQVPGFSRF